ncbi:FMN-dependent NADH-azoreductase [Pseudomonas sp. BJa5]|uniref:FMN-dependent NADH-azoreductase n=1 Tax=Pseudomonas sp. BJa5 TaxID=2936270 RepID=UPI002559744B|nr:NAD(P)H-dependent oxidoreductase [Pseudomonas sp. BGr12]MDL2421820.1 NAD(P)H-dependent oxidoreductase [Pseudomonas sp. BGr12]
MKRILHVSCSPRGEVAESFRLARRIIERLQQNEPTAHLTHRVIGDGSLPHIDADHAQSQASDSDVSPVGSMARSEALIQELECAHCIVISTPMHNLAAPSALKAWIDHVVRVRRTFTITRSGKVGLLADRPVYVAISSGGRFSGELARQPDFLTPYLKAILPTIGLHDLRFFSVQGTNAAQEYVLQAREHAEQALQEHFTDCTATPCAHWRKD